MTLQAVQVQIVSRILKPNKDILSILSDDGSIVANLTAFTQGTNVNKMLPQK
jgi:hypothetical protein